MTGTNSPKEKKSPDSTIVAAVITGVVTIIVTAITVFANRPPASQPTPTPVIIEVTSTIPPVFPTDTVPPDAPTSTPAPTNTPLPEPTSTATDVPLLTAGEDWLQNCISLVWQAYPDAGVPVPGDGCYQEPLANVFAMNDQHLTFFYEEKVLSAKLIGLFAEVPSDSLVEVVLHLDEISGGEVWVGIMGDMNVDARGLVLMAPQGNAKNSAFSVRTMPNFEELFLSSKYKKDGGDYVLSFDVLPTTVGATIEKYTPINPVPVASPKKYLFVGIRALPGGTNRITGHFMDLKITAR